MHVATCTHGLSLQPCVSARSPAHMVTELTKRPRLPDQKETDRRSRGQLRVQEGRPPSLAAMPCRTQASIWAPKQTLCEASALLPLHRLIVLKSNPALFAVLHGNPSRFAFRSSGTVWSRTLAGDAQGLHRAGLAP